MECWFVLSEEAAIVLKCLKGKNLKKGKFILNAIPSVAVADQLDDLI